MVRLPSSWSQDAKPNAGGCELHESRDAKDEATGDVDVWLKTASGDG